MDSSIYLKDCEFVKVVLASTAIDSSGDKISLKALNDLKNMCVNQTGQIRMADINVDCKIVYSFIDKSDESDGNGDVAYNLYGIIAFSTCGDGVFIDKEIERLGTNLYDVGRISYAIGPSEKLNNGVSHILGIDDFLYFLYDVRSRDSVRNQEKLNEVIKKSDICPFCGSKPIVTVDGENISGLDKFRVTIKCMNIECNVQPKTSFYDSSFTTACDMVLKHWNTRSHDSGIVENALEDTNSKLTVGDICINCADCANLKQGDDFKYCDECGHRIRDIFTYTCESFIPQRSKAIYSFDYCDQCLSYNCGYCKKRKRETNKDLWMPCCQHDKKQQTDTRCCVNCVNCHKDDNEMYYCINDNHYTTTVHPFKHTDCDDFEQKDSKNLSCVSETTEKDDKTSLCLSCEHADFGPDGCWCLKAESFVCTKLMNNCKYFDHVTGE